MLNHLLARVVHVRNVVRHAVRDMGIAHQRSSRWPKVERDFLGQYGECAACGSRKGLNVHHKRPFHLEPSLELDEGNLITLCMSLGKHCHLLIGHGDDFRAFVPGVEKLAAIARQEPHRFQAIVDSARRARQYGLSPQ